MADKAKCWKPCLNEAGRGQMGVVQKGRERKTMFYLSDRIGFMDTLVNDLHTFSRRQHNKGIQPCVRLDGTSDLGIAAKMADVFPEIQFYDYTKVIKRAYQNRPLNYHITLSYSEADADYAEQVLQAVRDTGVNAAVVFRDKIPATFKGLPVINGDADDLRFLDPKGVIVGLLAKGKKAKQDKSGFVIDC
tara:strand:- start:31 stop:600 length:570 start_codon:yes stop_codon:yes gene_type:complete